MCGAADRSAVCHSHLLCECSAHPKLTDVNTDIETMKSAVVKVCQGVFKRALLLNPCSVGQGRSACIPRVRRRPILRILFGYYGYCSLRIRGLDLSSHLQRHPLNGLLGRIRYQIRPYQGREVTDTGIVYIPCYDYLWCPS